VKKIIILLLSCMLVVMCLTACGAKEETSSDGDYYKMGEFGYFKGTGYQVYIETVGDKGTEVELVVRRTYCLNECVQSINAGEWSALMFESDIPSDKACQTVKVIKRAE